MNKGTIASKTKGLFLSLFNTRAAGLYMLLFAAAIGIATFVENDFGTSSAQKVIFQARWFELLLVLFGITIMVNISRFRMIQQKKWAVLTFHLAIVVILIGAGVTRYFGYEGVMHIRENDSSNTFLSAETYLEFEAQKNSRSFRFDEPVLFATKGNNNWQESYAIDGSIIEVAVEEFIPNPKQTMTRDENGLPTLKIVIGGAAGREEYFINPGQTRRIRGVIYNFTEEQMPNAINLAMEGDSMMIQTDHELTLMIMATKQRDTLLPSSDYYPLRLRSLYSDGTNNFVFGDFRPAASVKIESEGPKVKNESMTALRMKVSVDGEEQETFVYGKKGLPGRPSTMRFKGMDFSVAYGAKEKKLPFSIKLYDFIMEKYPGTNSASSYASEVQLVDTRSNTQLDYRIFMNNILDHDGYRFFQSSFDQDEQSTYLSVNYDFWGTWISYTGYILLTLGMFLTFFSKKSRFRYVTEETKRLRLRNSTLLLVGILCFGSYNLQAAKAIDYQVTTSISEQHLAKFNLLLVQDHKGRMKPMHTLTRELMRKLVRKESFNGQSAGQVILGMYANRKEWQEMRMIKLGEHEDIHKLLGVSGEYATYNDFFEPATGAYKLREEVRRAYGLQPIDRGVYEKELMKIDERINIASMVYSGRLFKLIPVPNDPNNTWVAQGAAHGEDAIDDPVAQQFFATYGPALQEAMETGDYTFVNKLLDELAAYQKAISAEVIPSDLKIKAEILLNESRVFARLGVVDFLLGMGFLFFLFVSVFKPNLKLKRPYQVMFGLLVAAFAFHTLGLAFRWYVSGRAPWSNGYESMIYIAWTSTLAGLIFSRKSFGGLAATMVLASTVLLVAHLSYLDPEITPLVPVLKSYWLTIHVSLEAGSYGFLMLGAIIGLINLMLMIFLTHTNKERIYSKIKELSLISEMTLYGGLFMVSIGTYLGGVWANESWGRYWGWDAKETWALVTILVYAFILHMRLIPKMGGVFAYNFASLFGWATVIMTYYGVNYYLSGLHSYAAGDPIPVPDWVYIATAVLVAISALAFWRKSKVDKV
jgi:cytochrome c-type biogenesis protein CcsB